MQTKTFKAAIISKSKELTLKEVSLFFGKIIPFLMETTTISTHGELMGGLGRYPKPFSSKYRQDPLLDTKES